MLFVLPNNDPMQPHSFQHRLACTLAPVVGVGALVLAVSAWLSGSHGAAIAAVAILVGLLIAALAEINVILLGLKRPLDRMLFTMLLRGGFSVVAIGAAIIGGGLDAKVIVLVALPIYLALLVGEAASAIGANDGPAVPSLGTSAFKGRV